MSNTFSTRRGVPFESKYLDWNENINTFSFNDEVQITKTMDPVNSKLTILGEGGRRTILSDGMLQLGISTPECNFTNKGAIIYDGNKHYGCDGGTWHAFY